ncbi:hypothetical protein [Luteimonas kalidii]|uniref:Uncharacterized protein n=1 Tax=Luteimonas kalidii TaxID=3042025 RepID=A0ABT6JX02_9GAMM|nr:hypothetical protein [Luteimonas kalidii]MDH5834471.1 hypothetical protein [Luteimonas kalidii]
MSRRPPQRSVHRSQPAADGRLSAAQFDPEPVSDASAGEPGASEQVDGPPPVATSRSELVELLDDLRQQGGLDVADEAAILRKYDALVIELRAEKAKLEAEFRERLARDGQDDTNAWLADAAEALGRRQGEQMRQLVQTIPGLSPGTSA